MSSALLIIAAAVVLALFLGLRARQGADMNLEQWSVGGRGFGAILVFLLMAGEIYTTFTFLGASGYAYGHGAAAYYIVSYACLAFTTSYWLLPPIWRYAKERNLFSQPDFFAAKYDSEALGILVAVVGLVALIPYLVLQFKGLGIIVQTASYGAVTPTVSVWIGAVVLTLYVIVSGVHGSAWTATVKDVMILCVIGFLGFYLPYHYYGGLGAMFRAIEAAKPGYLALPSSGQSIWWFSSTVLLTALGFYMWPFTFASIYTSKNERAFRQNAIVMPLYALVMLLAMFVGFAAILQVPGLTGPKIDLALLQLSVQTFDPWFVGVIGAAGVLTALVPGSMILIAAATMLANNLYRRLNPAASDRQISVMAKVMVPVVALVAVYFTLSGGETIVALLLMGYSFVTQLFPSLVLSLRRDNPATKTGAFAGICVGVGTVTWVTLAGATTFGKLIPGLPQWIQDLNTGIIALVFNIVTLVVVSAVTRQVPAARLERAGGR